MRPTATTGALVLADPTASGSQAAWRGAVVARELALPLCLLYARQGAAGPDAAEGAVRRLQADGIPMQNLSIIGKDFQAVEKPLGFVTTGTVAKEGAQVGAWTGGIFGLLFGAAFLIGGSRQAEGLHPTSARARGRNRRRRGAARQSP